MVEFPCASSHEYGLMQTSKAMDEGLCGRSGEVNGRFLVSQAQMVDVSVLALCPFQRDVRSMLCVEGDETTVQPQTFLLQYTLANLYSCLAQHCDASSIDAGKGVATPYYNRGDMLVDDELGTRWSLAVVGTRLKAYIDGASTEQLRLFDCGYCIDFGMGFATLPVIAFAYDASVAHHHSSYHRVRCCSRLSASCQLQATTHIPLVYFSLLQAKYFLILNSSLGICAAVTLAWYYRARILNFLYLNSSLLILNSSFFCIFAS